MAKATRTFLEIGIQRAGFKTTAKSLTWEHMWTVTRLDLGREPNLYEVAAWWNISRAQAFRYQQSYRRCWGYHKDPKSNSPWFMTQCALDQGITSERKLRATLKASKVFKGIGMTDAQREAVVDQHAQLVGLAMA